MSSERLLSHLTEGDTWKGEAVLPTTIPDGGAWTLAVGATSQAGDALDGEPRTVRQWNAGWTNYEDETGVDTGRGGRDVVHRIPFGLRAVDFRVTGV